MFTVTIVTDNEAFTDDPAAECARILERIAKRLKQGVHEGRCMDGNGNGCGEWSLDMTEGR